MRYPSNLVGIVTRVRDGRPKNWDSISVEREDYFFFTVFLAVTASIQWVPGLFPYVGKWSGAVTAEDYKNGAIISCSLCYSWCDS
jgi:hypothetical protein